MKELKAIVNYEDATDEELDEYLEDLDVYLEQKKKYKISTGDVIKLFRSVSWLNVWTSYIFNDTTYILEHATLPGNVDAMHLDE